MRVDPTESVMPVPGLDPETGMTTAGIARRAPRRRRACHGGGDLLDDRLASRRRREAKRSWRNW